MAFKTTYSQYNTTTGLFSTEGALDLTTLPSNENTFTASDSAAGDQFGNSNTIAVGNDRIVVGAYLDDIIANTDQGSAYIFDLNGTQLAKITASDGVANDYFGYSVAIGSGRIVVGAYRDDSYKGSAYIFDLDGTQLAKITASDGVAGHQFGISVAIGCGRIVVGARGDDVGANTNQGSAYIFDLDGTNETKITASDGAAQGYFGRSVAVGNGRIVVGTNENNSTGSAYIFDLDGNQLAKLTGIDTRDNSFYAHSVAIGNGRIVVGQRQGFSPSGRQERGAAHIYDLNGNLIKTVFDITQAYDSFGQAVAVGNGKIAVGSRDIATPSGIGIGGVFVYDLDGTQLTKINASDGNNYDEFGKSVAIGPGRIVMGTSVNKAYIYETPNIKDIFSIVDK